MKKTAKGNAKMDASLAALKRISVTGTTVKIGTVEVPLPTVKARTLVTFDADGREVERVPAKSKSPSFSARGRADQRQIDGMFRPGVTVRAELHVAGSSFVTRFVFDANGNSQWVA